MMISEEQTTDTADLPSSPNRSTPHTTRLYNTVKHLKCPSDWHAALMALSLHYISSAKLSLTEAAFYKCGFAKLVSTFLQGH